MPLATATPAAEPAVTVGPARFAVEVADTPETRGQGLSGRSSLEAGTGMLFVFEAENRAVFWMKDMQFPLDFVWIAADCTVADLTENVPPPGPDVELSDLPRYQPEAPVRYVLEINAGAIDSAGIAKGDNVAFGGVLKGVYGC